MSLVGLQIFRWFVILLSFAVPIFFGLVLAAVTFWFATWWPKLVGLTGNGYFLAAFLTSWTLFPYLWVFELEKVIKRADGLIDTVLAAIETSIRRQSV